MVVTPKLEIVIIKDIKYIKIFSLLDYLEYRKKLITDKQLEKVSLGMKGQYLLINDLIEMIK